MQIRINVKGASRRKAAIVQMVREYPDRTMTVEEFLAETVKQSLAQFREKREAGEVLRLFSKEELEDKASLGKVAYGSLMDDRDPDGEKAVKAALQGFEDGIAALFADGVRYTDLKEKMELHEQSEVTFVRLTFLAGRMW
ncbi:MAG: hypothetical protein IJG52_08280 [Lachnospiraceae bacterium]|nr:hypothetical protein [Lachnospiraceae bacterium]